MSEPFSAEIKKERGELSVEEERAKFIVEYKAMRKL